jgi:hypothetical protein
MAKGGHTGPLIQIALDEGEIDRAVELVRETQRTNAPTLPHSGGGWGARFNIDSSLFIQVARAAEQLRPQAAIDIYRHYVDSLIGARGRPAYQQAAQLLQRVRDLYARLGEQETWDRYIAGLRDRNRTLRALKEELAAAGL